MLTLQFIDCNYYIRMKIDIYVVCKIQATFVNAIIIKKCRANVLLVFAFALDICLLIIDIFY